MEQTKQAEQEKIRDWFNKTYESRSEQYLRPVRAYSIFIDLLDPKKGEKILDIACGVGRILQAAEPKSLELHGLDISEVAISKAKLNLPKAKLIAGNAEDLPYEDHSFDYITCIGSLERMIDLDLVLDEIKRVAQPNAKCCFMVRNSETLQWKLIKEKLGIKNKQGHQGAKSMNQWNEIFEKKGFKIEHIVPDQWRYKRILELFSLSFFPKDYNKIYKSLLPLKNAYEFIYLLSKA